MNRAQEYAFYLDEMELRRSMLEDSKSFNTDDNSIKMKSFCVRRIFL